jgi:hypothetical protein
MLADVVSGYVGAELADVREDDVAHDGVTELVGEHTEAGRIRGRGRFEESLCVGRLLPVLAAKFAGWGAKFITVNTGKSPIAFHLCEIAEAGSIAVDSD